MTLACEDANLELIEIVAAADVDAEIRVENGVAQIWKLKFGPNVKFLFRL